MKKIITTVLLIRRTASIQSSGCWIVGMRNKKRIAV